MPEWLSNVTTTQVEPSLQVLATRLVLAWVCGWVVAWLARRKQPSGTADTLTLTLVLMSILIAMATQIIGDNVARAFSLVGALSIVRFRTAVPATRDVAFMLAAVVVGMAAGAGQYWVSGLGLLVVGLATHFNLSETRSGATSANASGLQHSNWRLTLVVGLSATQGWQSEIERFSQSYQLSSVETARRGGAMELVYVLVPKPASSAVELVAALSTLPCVETVTTKVI